MNKNLKKILLVEDEAIISMAESVLLRDEGYLVDTVFSGEDAIEIISKGNRYDLILMDIDLGRGIDGTIAAEVILKKHNIPVIFLSNHTEPEYLQRTDKITSYGHVVKNSGPTVLLTSIKMAFRLHAAHKELLSREIMLESSMSALEKSESFNREILESLPVGIIVINTRGKIEYENRTLRRMIGLSEDSSQRLAGTDINDIKTFSEAGMLPIFAHLLKGKTISNVEFTIHSDSGDILNLDISVIPVFGTTQQLISGLILFTDSSERKIAQAESARYTEQLEFLSNSAMGFINLSFNDDIFLYIGRQLKQRLPDFPIIVTEYNPDTDNFTIRSVENLDEQMNEIISILGMNPLGLPIRIKPELMPDLIEQKIISAKISLAEVLDNSIPEPIVSRIEKLIQIDTIYTMGFAQHQKIYGHVVFFSSKNRIPEDFSLIEAFIKQASVAVQKRKAEEKLSANAAENEMLLLELQHRIKNSITIIAGLIELEKGKYDNTSIHEILSNIRDRIFSISALYDLLYTRGEIQNIPLNIYINEIGKNILASYISTSLTVNFETDLDEIIFDIKRALPVGLIINELITNSIKYAFTGRDNGIIRLSLKKDEKIKIIVSDNGTGLSVNSIAGNHSSLGLNLVQMLINQLNGNLTVNSNSGTCFEISIPIAE